jgi:hypothetical protein
MLHTHVPINHIPFCMSRAARFEKHAWACLKVRQMVLQALMVLSVLMGVFTLSTGFAATVLTPITVDNTSVVRNPMTGWVLYPMELGDMDTAGAAGLNAINAYWGSQDVAKNSSLASTVYIRTLWSRLESKEGVYAWNDPNDHWNELVDGAVKRGLKLAFRFYVQSLDVPIQATPQWVFNAGARSVKQNSGLSPYADDPVFQTKYAKFIKAFGSYIQSLQVKYNDPNVVSYVDGSGLGSWGEDHGTLYLNSNNAEATFRWLTATFREAMPRVLLASNHIDSLSWGMNPILDNYQDGSYAPRRDGIGSTWFNGVEKSTIAMNWQLHPLIAENCYHGLGDWTLPQMRESSVIPNVQSIRDGLRGVLDDAKNAHANLLDLRTSFDAETWNRNPDFVQEWVQQGGYRLSATSLSYPNVINQGTQATFSATWQNTGVGIFPNAMKAWSYKYKPAIALIQNGKVVYTAVDNSATDLSTLFKGGLATIAIQNDFTLAPLGTYELAIGVVDTQNNNRADIQLAITPNKRYGNWYVVGTTRVEAPSNALAIPDAPSKLYPAQNGSNLTVSFSPSSTGVPPAYYALCNTTLNKCNNATYSPALGDITITGATLGVPQKYQLSACNSLGKCALAPLLTLTLLSKQPAAPAVPVFSFTSGALKLTSIGLTVNLPASASGIQRKEITIVDGRWNPLKTFSITQYDTGFTIPDLQIGTWYGVSMVSVDMYGNRSARSNTQWIQTQLLPTNYSPPPTPQVPGDVFFQQQGSNLAVLLSIRSARDYYVVCDNLDSCTSSDVFSTANNTIILKSPPVGITKVYRAKTCNWAGNCSAFTPNVWVTVLAGSQAVPGAPFFTVNTTKNSLTVAVKTPWSASGVQRYKVNVVYSSWANLKTVDLPAYSSSYTVAGLSPGAWYGVYMSAQDTLGVWSPLTSTQWVQLPW